MLKTDVAIKLLNVDYMKIVKDWFSSTALKPAIYKLNYTKLNW